MSLQINMDWDWFDEFQSAITQEKKNEICNKFNFLTELADALYKQKKISKITRNRVRHIWSFFPHGQPVVPTKRFNQLFEVKEHSLNHIQTAINRCLKLSKLSLLTGGKDAN